MGATIWILRIRINSRLKRLRSGAPQVRCQSCDKLFGEENPPARRQPKARPTQIIPLKVNRHVNQTNSIVLNVAGLLEHDSLASGGHGMAGRAVSNRPRPICDIVNSSACRGRRPLICRSGRGNFPCLHRIASLRFSRKRRNLAIVAGVNLDAHRGQADSRQSVQSDRRGLAVAVGVFVPRFSLAQS